MSKRSLMVCVIPAFCLLMSAAFAAEQGAPEQQTEQGLKYSTSWFGTSWSGGPKWMQTSISYLTALPDGRILTASGWDEAHREATIYSKDGEIICGVVAQQGRAVGGDAQYAYAPVSMEVDKRKMSGVARFFLDQFREKETKKDYTEQWSAPAPFPGGNGRDGNVLLLAEGVRYEWAAHKRKAEIEADPTAADKYRRPPPQMRGIASDGSEVFVAEDLTHKLHVLDAETMTVKRTIDFRYPGPVALDNDGNLWVVQRPVQSEGQMSGANWLELGMHAVVQLSRDGKPTGRKITDAKIVSAIAFGGPKNLLYVADAAPDRLQVLIYDVAGPQPKRVGQLGTPGGVYAGPVRGRMGDDRLDVLSGVGVDAEGCVTVSTRGDSSFIRRYTPDGKPLWQRYTATFMNGSSFDTAVDGTVVYAGKGGANRFELDYSKPPGQEGTWVAVTSDPFRFPLDTRGYTGRVHRLPNGRLYLSTEVANGTFILRQEKDSEIFIPSVYLQNGQYGKPWPPNNPGKMRYMWRDDNGNGQADEGEYPVVEQHMGVQLWNIDDNGDLWGHPPVHESRPRQGFHRHKLTGFDEHGNPLWDFAYGNSEVFARPEPFHPTKGHTAIMELTYDALADTMYVFGYPHDFTYELRDSWGRGNTVLRYDNWTKPDERKLVSRAPMPYGPPGEELKAQPNPGTTVRAVYVAGELAFAAITRATEKGQVHLWNTRTGSFLGVLKPGPLLFGETSLVDIPDGLCAFRRENGEYIVTYENNWKNLQIVYRIPAQPLVPKDARPGMTRLPQQKGQSR
ncbi:MAG TPA: hypothetical protein VM223_19560 [Planctomycetota bacterium]|nr:hypothetical protein [Planctomycetota bacterium]